MSDIPNHGRAIDREEAYWRSNFVSRPYVPYGARVDDYMPAYRYGIDASVQFPDRSFSDLEDVLSKNWIRARGRSSLKWEKAKLAALESWTRMSEIVAAAAAAAAAAVAAPPETE